MFVLGVWSALPFAPAGVRAEEPLVLAVAVNRTNPVLNLTAVQLRHLVLGEQPTWPNGKRVTIVLREPGSPERALVGRACCRLATAEFDKVLLQSVFSGEVIGGPKVVNTPAAVRKFVALVPGAIGFLAAQDVDDTIRTVTVDGISLTAEGYLLRSR